MGYGRCLVREWRHDVHLNKSYIIGSCDMSQETTRQCIPFQLSIVVAVRKLEL